MALLVLLLPVVLVVTIPLALVLLVRTRSPLPAPEHAAITRMRERSARWLAAAIGLGLLTAAALLALGDRLLGIGAAVAPAVGGTMLVLTVCLGELLTPRQTTLTRRALPRARSPRDYVTGGPLVLATAALVALGATLLVGTLMGSPDDLGRAGRALTTVCGDVTSVRGPWPGSYYAIPIAVAAVVSTAVCVLACRVIATRPAPGAGSESVDDALRRWSTRTVLLALATAGWVTLVPLLALMGSALTGDCTTDAHRALGLVCGAGALVSMALAAGCFVALWVGPGRRNGQTPPPGTADRTPVEVPR